MVASRSTPRAFLPSQRAAIIPVPAEKGLQDIPEI